MQDKRFRFEAKRMAGLTRGNLYKFATGNVNGEAEFQVEICARKKVGLEAKNINRVIFERQLGDMCVRPMNGISDNLYRRGIKIRIN